MKVSKNYIRSLIKEELRNSFDDEFDIYVTSKDDKVLNFDSPIKESFSIVENENLIKESEVKIEELKSINEEIKRMKQLIDFRSPLLSKNDL